MRLDAQLFFANTNYFREKLAKWEAQKGPGLKLVVLNAKAINGLDSSAVHMLHDLAHEYRNRGIQLYVSGLKGPLRDVASRSGLVEEIGRENFFYDLADAVNHYRHGKPRVAEHVVMQTNDSKGHA